MKDSEQEKRFLIEFYTKQRDSHLNQLMKINGQGTFSVIAALAAIMVGVISHGGLKISELNDFQLKLLILIPVGIILIMSAAALYSMSYNKSIEFFESKILKLLPDAEISKDEYSIKPSSWANGLLFFGLMALLIGSLILLFTS